MSDVIITADRLGKSYRIGSSAPRERYTALRDVLAGQARGLVKGARRALRRQGVNGQARGPHNEDGEFWALRDVSFEIKRGEAVGIIGRNGAGKSTLLKILSRITEPTAGRVRLRGRVASLLEVGTGFHPELTGRENIYLNGAILGMTRAEIRRKFDEIVAFAEVEKFLDLPVKRYSSGMYVRLAFAVAAHLEPEILVVDEVLAVGDAAFQKRCLGKMHDVARQGRTVLFVSHNLAAITALCGRALLMQAGHVTAGGAPDAMVDRYWKSIEYHPNEPRRHFFSEDHKIGIANFAFELSANADSALDLTCHLDIVAERAHSHVGVGFEITTLSGVKVCSLWPMMTGFVLDKVTGHAHCSLHCPSISRFLAGGEYCITIWLSRPRVETLVMAPDALRFAIPKSDVYSAGVYFESERHGVVPLRTTFHASSPSHIER